MRVDLRLQQLHFRNMQIFLLLADPPDQSGDLPAHLVKRAGQDIDLLQTAKLGPGIPVSASKTLCRHLQAIDRSRHRIRKQSRKEDSRYQDHPQKSQKSIDDLVGLLLQILLQFFHIMGLIVDVLIDVILNHRAQALDIIFPDCLVFIVSSGLMGIFDHLLHRFFQGIQA